MSAPQGAPQWRLMWSSGRSTGRFRRARGRGPRTLNVGTASGASVAADLVVVGRVGRPHGLDGSFAVEDASEAPERFAVGATLYVDGEPARVEESKRSGGRPVIRL